MSVLQRAVRLYLSRGLRFQFPSVMKTDICRCKLRAPPLPETRIRKVVPWFAREGERLV